LCSRRKGDQADLIVRTLERMYPTRRWGEIDDHARFRAGVPPALAKKLARAATRALSAPTYLREGGEDELCDFIWILCVGRAPCLLEIREGSVPLDLVEEDRIQESYLRVALSSLVRAATIQEVQMSLRRQGGLYQIQERTRDGVYDPILLKRMQKMVDLIVRAGLYHFDFGMLSEDAPAEPVIDFGDYSERYGAPPSAAALLFSPRSPISVSTVVLDAS